MTNIVIMRMDSSGEMPVFEATERVFVKPGATEKEIVLLLRNAGFTEYPTLLEATESEGELE